MQRTFSVNDKNLTLQVLISYLVNFAHHKHHLMEEAYLLTDEFQNVCPGSRKASEILKTQHLMLYTASSWWMSRDMSIQLESTQVVDLLNPANRAALLQLIDDYRLHLKLEEALIWKRFFPLLQPLQFSEAAFMLVQSNDPLINCNTRDSIDVICQAISKSTVQLM